jgi:hypothetical protein
LEDPVEEIKDILEKGLRNDVFRAERAIAIHKEIAKFADIINETDKHKKILLKYLQNLTVSEAVLSTSKLYDPIGKYPTRSIHALLEILNRKCESFPAIREKHNTKQELKYLNTPEIIIEKVDSSNSSEFPKYFYYYYHSIVNDFETEELLSELKIFRDKSVAHNERIDKEIIINWNTVDGLLKIAKEIIGIIGWAYFNTVYMHNSRYILSADAKSITSAIRNIIDVQKLR